MSEADRDHWNQRYQTGDYVARSWPSPFLVSWLDQLPAGGRALDVACGTGRNALSLAEAGFKVEGTDISEVALAQARAEADRRGLEVTWQLGDCDDIAFEDHSYDLITVIRYVNRHLWPKLVRAIAPDGWILVEHHLQTTVRVGGPTSFDFRLRPQELLDAFQALRIIHYEEVLEVSELDGERYALGRMVACSGNPGW